MSIANSAEVENMAQNTCHLVSSHATPTGALRDAHCGQEHVCPLHLWQQTCLRELERTNWYPLLTLPLHTADICFCLHVQYYTVFVSND